MSFSEKISALSERIPDILDHLDTEEATKNALILPFISALGYDIFNPKEVLPEYTADVGTKKGEKVDYAIFRDGEIVVLIECKKARLALSESDVNQLYRYFSVTTARIAILTNGVDYLFFSDLEETNKMDARPFLKLNLQDRREHLLENVKKLSKDKFDLERLLDSATEMKYLNEMNRILARQLENPDEEIVHFLFSRINPGSRFVDSAKKSFSVLVQRAFHQFINEKVGERLRSALQHEKHLDRGGENRQLHEDGIITTEEEIEGYHIVKAILSQTIEPDRVVCRDTKSYMGILLDDNNRKPICRLWFNRPQKYISLFDDNKKEVKMPISELKEIYKYETHLKVTALSYAEQASSQESVPEEK